MKVAIGLSGGVDSSVAAALLKSAGHHVTGISMRLWSGKYRAGSDTGSCFGPGEEDNIRRAGEICKQLGIKHLVFDCSKEYEKNIIEYFRQEYLVGHTPNPCVRCNALIKFGVLPEMARSAGLVFDKFATGHYARICEKDGTFHLLRGVNEIKDQSYFLYRLSQRQLAEHLFPVGGYEKTEIRRLAAQYGLSSHDRPDSQDFYSGDRAELLNVTEKIGNIVDTEGKIIGRHKGFWNFTVGQRKGVGVAVGHPVYVLDINACKNEVIVGDDTALRHHEIEICDCNWISAKPEGEVLVKIRSTSKPAKAFITGSRISFPEGVFAATPGQSAVVYRSDETLGGGVICQVKA